MPLPSCLARRRVRPISHVVRALVLLWLLLSPAPASAPAGAALTRRSAGMARRTAAAADPTAAPGGPGGVFAFGMFEDANYVGTPSDFAAMVADLKARHFDTVLFTNNFTYRDAPLLGIADALGFGVVFAPHAELNAGWWTADAPATIEHARRVIYPLVDEVKRHPSLKGYNLLDDAPNHLAAKAALAVRAFRERDPQRPAAPVLVVGHEEVYQASKPDVLLTYVYPAVVSRPPCDFYQGEGEEAVDGFSAGIRRLTGLKQDAVPLWLILQTHGETREHDPASPHVAMAREPTTEEVRLQYWLALGEGTIGVFWFVYSTQQFWVGLRDNPPLLGEVTDLATRTRRFRDILPQLQRAPDQATVATVADLPMPFRPYASTLVSAAGNVYVIVANRSCSPQRLTVDLLRSPGWLEDIETRRRYATGSTLPFRGGDGKLFEVVDVSTRPTSADSLRVGPPVQRRRGGLSLGRRLSAVALAARRREHRVAAAAPAAPHTSATGATKDGCACDAC